MSVWKYLSHVLHILKRIKWKWNAKFQRRRQRRMVAIYAIAFLLFLLLLLCWCPAQVHNKNGDVNLKCNCFCWNNSVICNGAKVFFSFHPNNKRADHPLNRNTHIFFLTFISHMFFFAKRIKMENIVDTLEHKVKFIYKCIYIVPYTYTMHVK